MIRNALVDGKPRSSPWRRRRWQDLPMAPKRASPGAGATPGLARTVLREQVRNVLLERILSGRYAPGERLVETRIAQELGTSQAPVREALRELQLLRLLHPPALLGPLVRGGADEGRPPGYPLPAALDERAAPPAPHPPARRHPPPARPT